MRGGVDYTKVNTYQEEYYYFNASNIYRIDQKNNVLVRRLIHFTVYYLTAITTCGPSVTKGRKLNCVTCIERVGSEFWQWRLYERHRVY